MYSQSINFNISSKDYETIRSFAHKKKNTLSGLLREGATLIIEKYKMESVGNDESMMGVNES